MRAEISAPVIQQDHLGAKGYFYVGGRYVGEAGKTHMAGQMFVEIYVPKEVKHEDPVIMFHGAGQTNLNWLGTPDGRKGWADFFVEEGYVVYLAEQPARGRSAYHPEDNGPRGYHPVEIVADHFTTSTGHWEQAKLHTQWPEDGQERGSYCFDQFAAAQVEYLKSNKESQQLVLDAAGELLEKTGPAILLTHSQAGCFGWQIADAYPEMVRAIVAVEPFGPPFARALDVTAAQNYGLGELNLHFSPEVQKPEDFSIQIRKAEKPGELDGWVLSDNCHYELPTLQHKKILILTSEASYHAGYDHLLSVLLNQLGVEHEFVCLGEVGIHGNGHMMMLEKNNLEIARFICEWLVKR